MPPVTTTGIGIEGKIEASVDRSARMGFKPLSWKQPSTSNGWPERLLIRIRRLPTLQCITCSSWAFSTASLPGVLH